MTIPTTKEKLTAAYPKLKEKYGYKNVMQAPHIEKVIIAVGTGRLSRNDKKKNDFIAGRLATITGQKPSARPAKSAIIRHSPLLRTMFLHRMAGKPGLPARTGQHWQSCHGSGRRPNRRITGCSPKFLRNTRSRPIKSRWSTRKPPCWIW